MLNDNDLLILSDLFDKKLSPLYEECRQIRDEVKQNKSSSDKRFNFIDKHFDSIDKRFDSIDKRFDSIDKRFDSMEEHMKRSDKRLDVLEEYMKRSEKRFDSIEYELLKIKLLLEDDINPRLQNIESCYVDTFKRYMVSAEKIDALQTDVNILKKVAQDHSRKLQNS